jgi:hypothetical protein
MKDLRCTSHLLLIGVAVLFLAGCSGAPSSLAPAGSAQSRHRVVSYHGVLLPTAVVPKSAFGRQAQRETRPGLLLDARTRRLLYVSSFDESHPSGLIIAYSIPKLKYVYDITHGISLPDGECSKTGTKTFWAADSGADALYEFRYRGKRPIKTLSTSGVEPSGCSVDPASGDVAAAMISSGDVLVWPKGSGTPITYTTPLATAYFVGYDGSGDLFVDGLTASDVFGLAELSKGSSTFEPVTLTQEIEFPGNVQWDGTYLAIGDQLASNVYQFACSGTSCSEHGSTQLADAGDCVQFWIDKAILACPNAAGGDVGLWHYPAGGSPYATVRQIPAPLGSVIVKR